MLSSNRMAHQQLQCEALIIKETSSDHGDQTLLELKHKWEAEVRKDGRLSALLTVTFPTLGGLQGKSDSITEETT